MSHSTRRRFVIATSGPGDLRGLAAVLSRRGSDALLLEDAHDDEPMAPWPGQHFDWAANSLETTQQSVDALLAAAGDPDALVIRLWPDMTKAGQASIDLDEGDWRRATGVALLRTIHLLQSLSVSLQRSQGSVVFVGPSLSLVGATGLTALVTLLESQRGVMKSLARQWGRYGITCNWVAVEARELWPGFGRCKLPSRMEAIPVPLGRRPNASEDLAGVVEFFTGSAGRALTGITIALDGGEWMLP